MARAEVGAEKQARALAPPFGMAEFDIRYGSDIDALSDLLDLGVESGMIGKNGAYPLWATRASARGASARSTLSERADLRAKGKAGLPKTAARSAQTKQKPRRLLPKARLG